MSITTKLISPVLQERLDDRRRALVLIWISFALSGLIGAAWLLRALVAAMPLASHLLLGTTVLLFLVTPFILRWRGDLRVAAKFLVATLLAATLVVGLQNGGTEAPVLVMLFFAPVVATFLLGRAAGLVTFGAGVLIVAGLHSLYLTDLLPTSALSGEALRFARLSATILGAAAITAVVICYELTRVDSERQIRREQVRAQEAEKAQGEFLARMSHEIRTPLNAVIGVAELLGLQDLGTRDRELVSIIGKAGASLVDIANDVLDFSRIESGGLSVESHLFDPHECLETCVAMFSALANSRQIDLALYLSDEIPRRVKGDSGRLRQVLINLISNALKFTHQGSVYIEATAAPRGQGQLLLSGSVKDTGIGISSDLKDRIFEAFTQADGSMSRQYGGSGLGLTISRRLCEMMGGTLDFEPRQAGGTTFSFSVILEDEHNQSPGVVNDFESPSAIAGDLRVLVVEPGVATLRALTAMLDSWGLTPYSFGSWHLAANFEPRPTSVDLVLAGARPTSSEGCSLIDELVERKVPWVRIGTIADSGSLDGAQPELLKPIRRRDLMRVLNQQQAAPFRPLDSPERHQEQAVPKRFAGLSVLLAEDNPINQMVAQEMLQHIGCEVELATHGGEVMLALDKRRFDVVFLDLQMPEIDGLETARRIRSQRKPSPVLIALTASALKKDRDRCLEAGMNDFLAKPIQIPRLVEVLDRTLDQLRASEKESTPNRKAEEAPSTAISKVDRVEAESK